MLTAIYIAIGAVLAVMVYFFTLFPRHFAAHFNNIRGVPLPPVDGETRERHADLFVADLHCDALMWERDVLERGRYGHVDLPRLAEGNVALQVFSAVTKFPLIPRSVGNRDWPDGVKPLVMAQRWPRRTWSSLPERAIHQARKLHAFAARSGGRLVVVRTADDLNRFVSQRPKRPDTVAGVLLLEGAHALDGDPENVDRFFDAGYRIMGLVHFFDTDVGGCTHGETRGGITDLGRDVVRRMERLGMIVDLAHASSRLIRDVSEIAKRPVIVSHTGVKGTCDNPRNLSDEDIRRVAATGGVIGIGFWKTAVCGGDVGAIARAIRHAVDLVGAERVALGSDFDGGVHTPFDSAGLGHLTKALGDAGFDHNDIVNIMGGNALRLLRAHLPAI
jgi:microsomal dipeptidase-like Zn-dependent dipeptidase